MEEIKSVPRRRESDWRIRTWLDNQAVKILLVLCIALAAGFGSIAYELAQSHAGLQREFTVIAVLEAELSKLAASNHKLIVNGALTTDMYRESVDARQCWNIQALQTLAGSLNIPLTPVSAAITASCR